MPAKTICSYCHGLCNVELSKAPSPIQDTESFTRLKTELSPLSQSTQVLLQRPSPRQPLMLDTHWCLAPDEVRSGVPRVSLHQAVLRLSQLSCKVAILDAGYELGTTGAASPVLATAKKSATTLVNCMMLLRRDFWCDSDSG